jgi:predicted metalloprotease with PDZ domain
MWFLELLPIRSTRLGLIRILGLFGLFGLLGLHGPLTRAQGFVDQPQDRPYFKPLALEVDATDTDRRIFKVREIIPVQAGKLTLLFPRFLPGQHGPNGAVQRLAGLQIRAGNLEIPWVRDTVDTHAFHLTVPASVSELELQFQSLSPLQRSGGRTVMTRAMLNLQWEAVVLYPAGYYASAIPIQARVRLPDGWTQASALRVEGQQDQWVHYGATNLETLVDSPLFAGAHLRRVALDAAGSSRPVALNIVADEAALLQISDEHLNAHRRLVEQADRLFGARHFQKYDFLLALSDQMSGIGLEHHESSENGVSTRYFKDWSKTAGRRELLPHEYVHSWNGKFRRPEDLWTPHFNLPMQNSLLWLYEGQTDYWGRVLAARSGLVSAEQSRDNLARLAAAFETRSGRLWRNLQDTTLQATMGPRAEVNDWPDWQRNADYYGESTLIWLDADTLIREKTGGARSLDDFARAFFGIEDGRVKPLLYRFDDIVSALNGVVAYDWAAFLRTRLDNHQRGAPLDGLTRSGWQLQWTETPSPFMPDDEDDPTRRADNFAFSLGITLRKDGSIQDVLWESPAFRAGMSRALQVIAVNGQAYKPERLSGAITANKTGSQPITLLVKESDFYRTVAIDYRGGLRYPSLARIAGTEERLESGVLAARK